MRISSTENNNRNENYSNSAALRTKIFDASGRARLVNERVHFSHEIPIRGGGCDVNTNFASAKNYTDVQFTQFVCGWASGSEWIDSAESIRFISNSISVREFIGDFIWFFHFLCNIRFFFLFFFCTQHSRCCGCWSMVIANKSRRRVQIDNQPGSWNTFEFNAHGHCVCLWARIDSTTKLWNLRAAANQLKTHGQKNGRQVFVSVHRCRYYSAAAALEDFRRDNDIGEKLKLTKRNTRNKSKIKDATNALSVQSTQLDESHLSSVAKEEIHRCSHLHRAHLRHTQWTRVCTVYGVDAFSSFESSSTCHWHNQYTHGWSVQVVLQKKKRGRMRERGRGGEEERGGRRMGEKANNACIVYLFIIIFHLSASPRAHSHTKHTRHSPQRPQKQHIICYYVCRIDSIRFDFFFIFNFSHSFVAPATLCSSGFAHRAQHGAAKATITRLWVCIAL